MILDINSFSLCSSSNKLKQATANFCPGNLDKILEITFEAFKILDNFNI